MAHLHEIFIFLAAALAAVPIAKLLGLGSVLGYLVAGLIIGPAGLGLITDVESILAFSEFGVVLLLFIIGLELEPRRLWRMRQLVFVTGGLQVFVTMGVFAIVALAFKFSLASSIVIGLGLALSSTAFVLSTLTEGEQLSTKHGHTTFGILLFQDLAVIPALAALPLLGADAHAVSQSAMIIATMKVVGVFAILILAGRFLIRPVFRLVALSKSYELFTTASLFIVIGTGLLMESVSLSMSLGAFAAGVLLANSEYRHEMEAKIEPFRGLLMGLFFMAVGMSTHVSILLQDPLLVLGIVFGFIAIKFGVLYMIGRFSAIGKDNATCVALNLAVGGEFAFVLYGLAAQYNIIDAQVKETLILAVTLSMIVSPLLLMAKDYIFTWSADESDNREFDKIDEDDNQVIIAGFGRFGQIIGRLLNTQKISYTALEASAQQVDFVRRFGTTLYYGDASNLELLRAAKADRAKILVVAVDDHAASLRTVEAAQKYFPHLTIYARARNRQQCFDLLDAGVTNIYRETFLSSLEVGEHVLLNMGMTPEKVRLASDNFRRYDEETILRQHANMIHKDEKMLQEDAKKYLHVLENLMSLDETIIAKN